MRLLLDLLRESVLVGAGGSEMIAAWKCHQEMMDSALGGACGGCAPGG